MLILRGVCRWSEKATFMSKKQIFSLGRQLNRVYLRRGKKTNNKNFKSMKVRIASFLSIKLLGVLLIIFFASCSMNNHPYQVKHSLIIDVENPDAYVFSDLHPDKMDSSDVKLKNGEELEGGHRYSYTIENGVITVTTGITATQVKFFKSGLDTKPTLIEVENNTFSYEPGEYGHLIVIYPWLE